MSKESEPLFPLVWRLISKLIEENNLSRVAVGEAIKQVLKYYNNCCLGFIDLPYDRAEFRCAYIYLYLTSHIRMVQYFFEQFWGLNDVHFKSWFERIQSKNDGRINVCSIGGGPGTDIFGLYLFINKHSWPVFINGTVLDQYPKWTEAAANLDSLFMERNLFFCGDIQYMYYNFFQEMDITLQEEISRADLLTMVKFVSAVGGNQDDTVENFQKILLFMKPGSLLYFVENSGGGYRQAIEKTLLSLDFRNIFTFTHKLFTLENDEVKEMKSHKIHCSPQKATNVTASLWRKPEISDSNVSSKEFPFNNIETKFMQPVISPYSTNSESSSSESSPEILSIQSPWRSWNREQSNSSSNQSSSIDSSRNCVLRSSVNASNSSSSSILDFETRRRRENEVIERCNSTSSSDQSHEIPGNYYSSVRANTSTSAGTSSSSRTHLPSYYPSYRPNASSYSTDRVERNVYVPDNLDRPDTLQRYRNSNDYFYPSFSSIPRNENSRNPQADRPRESNSEEGCVIL